MVSIHHMDCSLDSFASFFRIVLYLTHFHQVTSLLADDMLFTYMMHVQCTENFDLRLIFAETAILWLEGQRTSNFIIFVLWFSSNNWHHACFFKTRVPLL